MASAPSAPKSTKSKPTRWNNDQYAESLSREYVELADRLSKQTKLPPAIRKALREGPDSPSSSIFDEMLKP